MKVEQTSGTSTWVHAPRQARSQETFDRFLAATADLLAERSFDDITVTDIVKRAEDAAPEHRGWFEKALRSGVKMALGSDLRPLRDSALLEMELWVKDGATPQQTIEAATRHAAHLCGAAADLGTVEVGKIADLIVVRDNPLDDIHHLRSLQLVLKDGRVVADHRQRARA